MKDPFDHRTADMFHEAAPLSGRNAVSALRMLYLHLSTNSVRVEDARFMAQPGAQGTVVQFTAVVHDNRGPPT